MQRPRSALSPRHPHLTDAPSCRQVALAQTLLGASKKARRREAAPARRDGRPQHPLLRRRCPTFLSSAQCCRVGESCATPRLAAPAAPAAPAPVSLALNLPSPFLAVGDSHAGARACQVERLAKLPPAEVVYSNLVSQMLPGSVLRVPNPAAHLVALLGHHSSGGDADGGGGGERE